MNIFKCETCGKIIEKTETVDIGNKETLDPDGAFVSLISTQELLNNTGKFTPEPSFEDGRKWLVCRECYFKIEDCIYRIINGLDKVDSRVSGNIGV